MKFINKRNIETKSYFSNEIKRFFLTISEIPWAGLVSLSTIWGSLTLFLYFKSVDASATSDLATLVKLAGGASLCSLIYLLSIGILFILPGYFSQAYKWLHKSLNVEEVVSPEEFVFGLVSVVSISCLITFSDFAAESGTSKSIIFWIFSLLTMTSIVVTFYNFCEIKNKSLFLIIGRTSIFFFLGFYFFTPFYIYEKLLERSLLNYFESESVFFEVFTLLIVVSLLVLFNLSIFMRFRKATCIVAASFLVGYAEFFIPIITHKIPFFPTVTAAALDLRTESAVSLFVPKLTCDLIKLSLIDSEANKLLDKNNLVLMQKRDCKPSMNLVHAQILSNVGSNWRIVLFDMLDGVTISSPGISMSIPAKDVFYPNSRKVTK